ncbi:MAG: hypothetical protein WC004_00605 [Candidatus Absconditabacterales bacterium]
MNELHIPSPEELLNKPGITAMQEAMAQSLVEILSNKFAGPDVCITLTEILTGVDTAKVGHPKSTDRDKLELIMSKHGRRMSYDGPAYNESYDSNYTIGKKKTV